MFGIGMPELLLILVVALIVIGPKKLPDLAKSLGRAMSEFRRATSEIKDSLEIDNELSEVRKAYDKINKDVIDIAPSSSDTDKKTDIQTTDKKTEKEEKPKDGIG